MSLIPPVVHDVPTDAIFAAAFAGVAPTDGVIVNYAGVLYIRNAGIWSSVGGMSTTIPSTGTASAPVAGSWLSGQLAIDSSERIWFCTVSGTPGTWVLTDTVGVATFNTRTGAVTLLKADVTGTGLAPGDIAAAPLASPGLTGTPTAPTATALDNSTKLATTAYADAAVAVVNALVTEIETDLGELAPLASPALTGTPTVPTAAPGTNTTQAASTAFVAAALPAASAMTLISAQVLGAPAATVTFSAIPGTFHHLRLVAATRTTSSVTQDNVDIQFNADTGAHYDYQRFFGNTTSTIASSVAAATKIVGPFVAGANGAAGEAGYFTLDIPGYALTTYNKGLIQAGGIAIGTANDVAGALQGQWRSTAAITEIDLSVDGGGNFGTGSAFYLYGII